MALNVVRRRLFWKIYITLLVSLVAATVCMSVVFWFLDEAREATSPQRAAGAHLAQRHRGEVSLYEGDGRLVAAHGRTISMADYDAHHWGPNHVVRIELPDGRFALTRFGPPARTRALHFLLVILMVAGSVGLAAYPVTALLTRRLESLRAGMTRWGEMATPIHLDDRGSDEVALLARTFNTAAARIDAMLTSQKALLANASHELRSPLARLRVAVEFAIPETRSASREEIVRNLTEMDQLVDELLLSSRLDHPDVRAPHREPIDLLGLAAEEGLRCDAQVSGDPVEIFGDPVLIRRLVRNLVENGCTHGSPPVTVTVAHDGDGARIEVGDAGRGIAAAERERIFEPFYRPAGSAEAAGGWGLGLALVRQIARRHGGDATCVDAPHGGSRFVVRLAAGRATDVSS